jgi:hypothetical protein
MFLPLEVSFSGKISKNFSHGWPPYFVVAPELGQKTTFCPEKMQFFRQNKIAKIRFLLVHPVRQSFFHSKFRSKLQMGNLHFTKNDDGCFDFLARIARMRNPLKRNQRLKEMCV